MTLLRSLLFLTMASVVSLAAHQLYQDSVTEEKSPLAHPILDWPADDILRIQTDYGGQVYHFERRATGIWWMVQPMAFPVNLRSFLGNYQLMLKFLPEEQFSAGSATTDFGWEQPAGSLVLFHKNGQKKQWVLSSRPGPMETVYLKNPKTKTIVAIHRGWTQFLVQPLEGLLSGSLWAGVKSVTGLDWQDSQGQTLWSLKQDPEATALWKLISEDHLSSLPVKQIQGVMEAWNRVTVTGHRECGTIPFEGSRILKISTQGGEREIVFSDTLEHMFYQNFGICGDIPKGIVAEALKSITKAREHGSHK